MAAPPTDITRPAKTAGYRPSLLVGSRLGLWLDGRPPFSWLEAERMRYSPQVQMGLRILRAPLYGATWKVEADSAKVENWAQRQSEHIYRKMLPALVRFFEYGVDGGELVYASRRIGGKTRIHFKEYLNVHPRDLQPWTKKHAPRGAPLACLQVRNVEGSGTLYLDRRHSFWFRGESEYGDWWGRPRLAGAYSPWFDQNARHGANDMLRLFYRKVSFRGPSMRYPPGMTDMGSPETGQRLVSNQDIAREIVEKFETGGVLALPSVMDERGNDFWRWEDPKSFSDMAGLSDYKKMLDRDILVGLGIPPELVDAATVGSGYSGRAIPAQVFFTSMDETVALILDAIDRQVLRWLVKANFGPCGYVIKPVSLAQQVAAGPPQPGAPGAGGPPGGGGPGMPPYVGPRGGHGHINPQTGRPIYDRKPRVRLSWQNYGLSRTGHQRWVSETGEIRYQEHPPEGPSARGPEAVFDHYAQQGVQVVGDEPDYANFHGGVEKLAAAHGADPAEGYKVFAGALDEALAAKKQFKFPAHRHGAYQYALDSTKTHFEDKAAAGAFAEGYWSQPSALRRAAFYLKHADDLDAAHLDADTREAIAGDLASVPPGKLAAHVARAAEQYGTEDARWDIAKSAAAAAPAGKPVRFDPAAADQWYAVSKDELNDDQWAGLVAAARVAPGAAVLSDSALVWRLKSPLDKTHEALGGNSGGCLNDADAVARLFSALSTPIQVAERDVPASAKNYGKVSGHLDPGAVADDWNARAVDAYRRVNKDWFVVVRGLGHAAAGTDEGHAFVPAGQVPPLARLPEPYWAGYDPTPDYDGDAQDREAVREEKNDPHVIAGRREVTADGWTTARDVVKAFGKLKGEHKRTENVVRRDEAAHAKATTWAGGLLSEVSHDDEPHGHGRAAVEELNNALEAVAGLDAPDHGYDPDEFDFEPDVSPLGADGEGYSREEKTDHLDDLKVDHRTLAEQVKEARGFATDASEHFGDSLRDALDDARRAAQAVLTLPAAEVSAAARALAERVNREALRQNARSQRPVKLSLTAASPADARRLWDELDAPVLVPIGVTT